MDGSTRNFHAHGGNEWVIGGKLTFLPGAIVEGVEGLFGQTAVEAIPFDPVFIPDSEAVTVATLRADFNALLSALRSAGLLAAAPDEHPGE